MHEPGRHAAASFVEQTAEEVAPADLQRRKRRRGRRIGSAAVIRYSQIECFGADVAG